MSHSLASDGSSTVKQPVCAQFDSSGMAQAQAPAEAAARLSAFQHDTIGRHRRAEAPADAPDALAASVYVHGNIGTEAAQNFAQSVVGASYGRRGAWPEDEGCHWADGEAGACVTDRVHTLVDGETIGAPAQAYQRIP
eukprot:SAG11_NODE_106_length_16423_cov_51.220840_24_plen_138_part_00